MNPNKPGSPEAIAGGLLAGDMAKFEAELQEGLDAQKGYLSAVERDLYSRGKRLRPILVILSARLINGEGALPDSVPKGAASLEMLHVASLIHDDIIDGADLRRGRTTVSAARGTGAAVVIGDMQFLYAIRGFIDCVNPAEDMELVRLMLDNALDVCRGEMDELSEAEENAADLKRRYMETADRKTVSLFGLACEAGAKLAGGDTEDSRRLGFFGRRLGRAFQIMDDLLDFTQDEGDSGKNRGADIINRRFTLPIIYAIEELGECHPLTLFIRQGTPPPDGWLEFAINAVTCSGGFSKAYAEARVFALEALEYLRAFSATPYKTALEDLAMYIINR
jgi:heptaprenyl diphosphate synthase